MNYNSPASRMPQPTPARPPMLGPQPVRPMNGNSSPWVNQAQPGMQMAALPPRRTPGRPAPPVIGPSEGGLMDRVNRDGEAQRVRDAEAEREMKEFRNGIYGPDQPEPPMPRRPNTPPPPPYPPRPPYRPLRPYPGQTQMPVYPPPRQAPYPVFG